MSRKPIYSQRVFPNTFEFTATLARLRKRGVKTMMAAVWSGLDHFKTQILDRNPPPSREYGDLERDLTEIIVPHIHVSIEEGMPYYLHHEKKEREQAAASGQPPEPDLSFVFFSNPRVTFPIDSKVIEGDSVSELADYVDTMNNRFLNCTYAPFSKEGAMLGFLLAGSTSQLFLSIEAALPCRLSTKAFLAGRTHRTSRHERIAKQCRFRRFVCHHLVFPVGATVVA